MSRDVVRLIREGKVGEAAEVQGCRGKGEQGGSGEVDLRARVEELEGKLALANAALAAAEWALERSLELSGFSVPRAR